MWKWIRRATQYSIYYTNSAGLALKYWQHWYQCRIYGTFIIFIVLAASSYTARSGRTPNTNKISNLGPTIQCCQHFREFVCVCGVCYCIVAVTYSNHGLCFLPNVVSAVARRLIISHTFEADVSSSLCIISVSCADNDRTMMPIAVCRVLRVRHKHKHVSGYVDREYRTIWGDEMWYSWVYATALYS